nr:protein IQ-DOMAIN 1-like isoform X1 [Coffea arabica]
MGSGDWFKTFISLKKVKEDGSKHGKGKSAPAQKANGSMWRYLSGKESTALAIANGSSSKRSRRRGITEDTAATRIQTAFRRYVASARKAVHRLRAIGRCRGAIAALTAEKQASSALIHIHFWNKMQAEIKARRQGMVNENRIQQKKQENRLKLEAKLQELEVDWCGGSETMEEILQRIQQREVAAVKRERAMAYAFSHQWRANSSHYFGQAYYDLGKDSWGWSWKERWIAVRPWETRVLANSKKVHSKQGDRVWKTTSPAAMKLVVTVKPSLFNGKGLHQARQLPDHIIEKQASQKT